MKRFTVFFVTFFLFSFVGVTLAAEIKVEDASTTDAKSVVVSVDTGTETTGNIKAVIEHSEDVTITDVTESDVPCSTFSYVPTNNRTEVICTLSTSKTVKGTVAEIKFTSDSEDYQFRIIREETIIGDLTIEKISNMGSEDVLDANTETETMDENVEPVDNQEEQTVPSNSIPTTVEKTEGIMAYLPYILLGVAGIFFVSMMILVLTRKKEAVVLTDLPASTAVASASTEPQPTIQPVNFDNIPENLQNETMQDNIQSQKPTLEEIVNQASTDTPPTPLTEPTAPTSTTGTNAEEDLQALLRGENSEPIQAPDNTIEPKPITQPLEEVNINQSIGTDTPQVQQDIQPEQPMTNNQFTPTTPITTMPIENTNTFQSQQPTSTDNGSLDDSFDFSSDGLPTIGSLDPINQTAEPIQVQEEPTVNMNMEQQPPVMPTVEIPPTDNNLGVDNDLQNLQNTVTQEINGLANMGTNENIPTNYM